MSLLLRQYKYKRFLLEILVTFKEIKRLVVKLLCSNKHIQHFFYTSKWNACFKNFFNKF